MWTDIFLGSSGCLIKFQAAAWSMTSIAILSLFQSTKVFQKPFRAAQRLDSRTRYLTVPYVWLDEERLVFHPFIHISIYSWIHLDIHTPIIGILIIQRAPCKATEESYILLFGNKGQEAGRGPFSVLLSGGTEPSRGYGFAASMSVVVGELLLWAMVWDQTALPASAGCKSLHTDPARRQALPGERGGPPTFSLNPRLTSKNI